MCTFFDPLLLHVGLTCVLEAGWTVGGRGKAVGAGLERRGRLVADALGPLPALHCQTSTARLVTVDSACCGRRQGKGTVPGQDQAGSEGTGKGQGAVAGQEARGGWSERVRQRDEHRSKWQS